MLFKVQLKPIFAGIVAMLAVSVFTFGLLPIRNSHTPPGTAEVTPVDARRADSQPALEGPVHASLSETNTGEKKALDEVSGEKNPRGITTYAPTSHRLAHREQLDLELFSLPLRNGNSHQVRGIYAGGFFQLRVQQQPEGEMGYVSVQEDVVTQFSRAALFNVYGFLAHNDAAGRLFYNLSIGDLVYVVYGDGSFKGYQVTETKRYQALQGCDPDSDFINLETGRQITADALFKQVYTGSHHLVLQTCICQQDDPHWGRYFVIAEPVGPEPPAQ